jgi:hypothetical protein
MLQLPLVLISAFHFSDVWPFGARAGERESQIQKFATTILLHWKGLLSLPESRHNHPPQDVLGMPYKTQCA